MTTRPNAARLIAAYQRGEPLPRQLTRDEIREVLEEGAEAKEAGVAIGLRKDETLRDAVVRLRKDRDAVVADGECSHGVHGPWCREWERMRERAEKAEREAAKRAEEGRALARDYLRSLSRPDLITALRADLAAGMCPPSRTECAWCETKRGVMRSLDTLAAADARMHTAPSTIAEAVERAAEPAKRDYVQTFGELFGAARGLVADPDDACAWCLDPACSGSPCRNTSKPEPWVPKVGDVVNVWAGGEEARVITVVNGFIEVRFNDRQERWPRDTVRPVREGSR